MNYKLLILIALIASVVLSGCLGIKTTEVEIKEIHKTDSGYSVTYVLGHEQGYENNTYVIDMFKNYEQSWDNNYHLISTTENDITISLVSFKLYIPPNGHNASII